MGQCQRCGKPMEGIASMPSANAKIIAALRQCGNEVPDEICIPCVWANYPNDAHDAIFNVGTKSSSEPHYWSNLWSILGIISIVIGLFIMIFTNIPMLIGAGLVDSGLFLSVFGFIYGALQKIVSILSLFHAQNNTSKINN
jgi:hypothetical protein